MKNNRTPSRITIALVLFAIATFFSYSINAQTQTIKPVYQRLASTIGGFYESLPVDYASQPTKKYPLIIFMHGSGEKGDGSASQLPRVLRNGPPKLINQGKFPAKFNVNGEEFSFVVVAPQVSTGDGSSAYIKVMLDYCLKNYRIDEQRIYITGLSLGGLRTYNYLAYKKELTDKIAASLLVCPNAYSYESRAKTIASSNVPVWLTNNDGDPLAKISNAIKTVDMINAYNPTPKAKITIFDRDGHDAWTQSYNPAFKEDGMNVYEWMLSYTTPRNEVAPVIVAAPPIANAGADKIITLPVDSTELNGSASTADSVDIKTYQWTYAEGPTAPVIVNAAQKITTIKNLVEGTHVFVLKVTDNNGSSDTDSVTVIVKPAPKQTIRPVYQRLNADLGGFYESLPVDYASQPNKKYPLIIFLHSSDYRGDGSPSELPKVLENGLAKVINDGKFPTRFNVNGKEFSFIVMAPQVESGNGDAASIISMIEYCSKNYRIDEQRIYVTGIGLGGLRTYNYLAYKKELTDKIAASLLVCPNAYSTQSRAKTIASSNVPVWLTNNDEGPWAYFDNAIKTVDMINGYNPANKAKLTIFNYPEQGAWSQSYDPAFKEDGVNVYEWMLSYTTPRNEVAPVIVAAPPIANAGADKIITLPVDSTELNGSASTADSVDIKTYQWTYAEGPTAPVIVNAAQKITTIKNLVEGTHVFVLKVTDNNGSSDTDSVTVIVKPAPKQTIRPVYQRLNADLGGFYESLPVDYASQPNKKYPLIIFLHSSDYRGDGSPSELPKVLENGLAKVINDGKFPTRFNVNGKEFSFIVMAPQVESGNGDAASIISMIEYCSKNYRIDEQRIYVTGIGLGGLRTYNYLAYKKELTDKIAASLLVCPNAYSTQSRAKTIASSNVPVWLTNNDEGPWAYFDNAIKTVDMINAYNPANKAKLTIFNYPEQDAWSQSYDPAFEENGVNVYEWMLSYTTPRNDTTKISARKASAVQENLKTATIATTVKSGINGKALSLSVKPNPVTSSMQVQIDGAAGNGFIQVYDMQGRMMQYKVFSKQSTGVMNVNMEVDRLGEGAYVLQVIINGNLKKATRFIKL